MIQKIKDFSEDEKQIIHKAKKEAQEIIKKSEEEIERLESEIKKLDTKLSVPETYEALSKDPNFFNSYNKCKWSLIQNNV